MEKQSNPVELFTDVAPRYEFLNALMTAGQDRRWRQALVQLVGAALAKDPERIVDLACGTGDMPRLFIDRWPKAEVIGTDPNEAMLEQAQKKARENKQRHPLWQRIHSGG